MNQFNTLNRAMTTEEVNQMNEGFDRLSIEKGLTTNQQLDAFLNKKFKNDF